MSLTSKYRYLRNLTNFSKLKQHFRKTLFKNLTKCPVIIRRYVILDFMVGFNFDKFCNDEV